MKKYCLLFCVFVFCIVSTFAKQENIIIFSCPSTYQKIEDPEVQDLLIKVNGVTPSQRVLATFLKKSVISEFKKTGKITPPIGSAIIKTVNLNIDKDQFKKLKSISMNEYSSFVSKFAIPDSYIKNVLSDLNKKTGQKIKLKTGDLLPLGVDDIQDNIFMTGLITIGNQITINNKSYKIDYCYYSSCILCKNRIYYVDMNIPIKTPNDIPIIKQEVKLWALRFSNANQ